MPRVMLIGLDCVPPELAFERYAHVMPVLSALRARGVSGPLRSTFPPITVPAWAAMTSGRDPGELGLYGFRKRVPGSYGLALADARDVTAARLWDVAAVAGKRSSVLFVPPSYPVAPVVGQSVACFLTPEDADVWTHPRALSGELVSELGPYVPDVDVRHGDRSALFDALCALTRQRFAIARHVWQTRAPELLVMVDIAPDRMHHAFLDVIDPRHPRHDPRASDASLGARYYALLDAELGQLCALADDDTAVIVASDHGAQPLAGCFLVNEWLAQRGYLVLRDAPPQGRPLTPELVDWARTRAWAEGGYYARIALNLSGREPQGIVAASERDPLLARLRAELESVTGPHGERWQNLVAPPAELYRSVQGFPPDLCAAFDGFAIRALSTVGSGALYAERDDRGPDVANHSMHGIFVAAGAGVSARGELSGAELYDVGASALALLGVPRPRAWLGVDRTGRA